MYQNPAESPRHAIDPPAVPLLTPGIGAATGSPVSASERCRVPSSVPCEDSETATMLPSGEGTYQSIAVAPARIDRVRVDQHPLGRDVARIGKGHQEGLLLRRLLFQREVRRSAPLRPCVRRGIGCKDLLRSAPDVLVGRQRSQVRHRPFVLGLRPRPRLLGARVLEPSIVLGHVDAVVRRRHGHARRLDRTDFHHRSPCLGRARGGIRTHTVLRPSLFKSDAAADYATRARSSAMLPPGRMPA